MDTHLSLLIGGAGAAVIKGLLLLFTMVKFCEDTLTVRLRVIRYVHTIQADRPGQVTTHLFTAIVDSGTNS